MGYCRNSDGYIMTADDREQEDRKTLSRVYEGIWNLTNSSINFVRMAINHNQLTFCKTAMTQLSGVHLIPSVAFE